MQVRLAPCAALVALLAACAPSGGPAPGRHVHLARSADLARESTGGSGELAAAGDRAVRLRAVPGGFWLEAELRRADWTRHATGYWQVLSPVLGRGFPHDGTPPHRLTVGERELEALPASFRQRKLGPGEELAPGSYHVLNRNVRLWTGDEPPPEVATLAVFVSRAEEEGGRVTGQRFTGEGLAVLPGEAVEVAATLPPASVLRLGTCFEPALDRGLAGGEDVRFRVLLDGEPLLEHRLAYGNEPLVERHTLALPAAGRAEARLRFDVTGPFAHTAFLAPIVGPVDPAAGVEDRRPDLVVFLADTFRADNLAAYGGSGELAPAMDRLAREGVVFRRAWSTGTYTLPAHASMFTGVFPRQAGIQDESSAVPPGLPTVAEVLSAAGYRTGAVTDSVFVSQRFGLARGFELFDERRSTFASTLERVRAFLDADDGRPVFLFVQSYRAHMPYKVEPATRARFPEVRGKLRDHVVVYKGLRRRPARTPEDERRLRAAIATLHAFYRGAAADLDAGFAEMRGELEGRGMLERGFLVLTSDHGEAFWEHGELYHGGRVMEEQVRVPLVVHGGGLAPRVVERAASLVDLPSTLAHLAGVAPAPGWVGRPLLADGGDERPVFAFQCQGGPDSTLALIEGTRKLVGYEDADALAAGRLHGAYDLAADPAESESRADEPWAGELLRRLAPAARALLEPRVAPARAQLGADELEELRALGYGE